MYKPVLRILFFSLAFAPLLMFAYLGTYGRVFLDDYGTLGTALNSSIWESLLYWWKRWSGEYSLVITHSLLAPVAVYVPSFFPLIIILIGLPGTAFLFSKFMAAAGLLPGQKILAVALAALALASVINGLYTAQTYLWYSATAEYTLPVVLMILSIVLAAEFAEKARSVPQLGIAAIGATLFGFINGGFGEMTAAVLFVFMTSMVSCIAIFTRDTRRQVYLTLAIACVLGLLASLALQLLSPGVAYRSSLSVMFNRPITPIRDLTQLTIRTMEEIVQLAGHQQAFAGFALMLGAGIAAALVYYQPRHSAARPRKRAFATKSTVLGLFVQLAFIPILWSHNSDNVLFFGRFSFGFALVAMLNLALVSLLAIMLWRRGQFVSKLAAPRGIATYTAATFFVIVALFALSQLRSIHHRAASFLFISVLTLVNMLAWQLVAHSGEARLRQFTILATLCTIFAGLTFSGQAALAFLGNGWTTHRIYTAVTFLQVIAGLLYGLSLGALVKRECFSVDRLDFRAKICVSLCILVVMILAIGIIMGHLPHIETAKENARIWDATHAEILGLIEAEDPAVYTRAFNIRTGSIRNLYHVIYTAEPLDWYQKVFYGLDPRNSG